MLGRKSRHDKKKASIDAPLTQSEQSRNAAATMEVDMGHTREYVHSVLFPMSTEAVAALKSLDSNNVVQLVRASLAGRKQFG